jgi:tetratricopeptide (TPR) repeat protein
MKTKKTLMIIGMFLFLGISFSINAQEKYGNDPNKCRTNLSLFNEAAKVGNYSAAYEPWKWCMDNCPESSKVLYALGLKMVESYYDEAAGYITPVKGQKIEEGGSIVKVEGDYFDTSKMNKAEMAKHAIEINKVYDQRIQYFPENLGKVYSDWANTLFKRAQLEKTGDFKDDIYDKLTKSFKEDPSGMSVKNLAKYFEIFTEKNKDTNPQLVFDTYDEINEAVNGKMDAYSKGLDKINEKADAGQALTSKEKKQKYAAEVNLTALGQVEGYLDNSLSEIATCERLIPLYTENFNKYKTDPVWLKRAVSRLNQKECTADPLYPKMVEAYVNADPSSAAYVFYAGILLESNQDNKAMEYFNKAISLETDNYKKARYYYQEALIMKNKGAKSQSRDLCYKALKERPSMGSAYLLIANLYASSANSCGTDELSKRMVYVAAADKAARAKSVDPSITSTANKYISSYMASAPTKKLVFTEGLKSGTPYKIGCWINETALIP